MDKWRQRCGLPPWVTQNSRDGDECSLATEEISPRTLEVDPPLVSRMITVFSYAWSINSEPVHPGGAYMTDMSGDGRSRSLSYVCMDEHKRNVQDGSMEIVDDQRRSEAQMIKEAHNVVRAPKHRPPGDTIIYIGKSR